MKPSLQVRQTQQLKLTAQLHQSFHLLQISTVDLDQEIEQAVDANPFLERLDDQWQDTVSLAPDSSLRYRTGADDWPAPDQTPAAPNHPGQEIGRTATDEAYTEYAAAPDPEDSPWGSETGSGGPPPEGDDDAVGATFIPGESLHEHLREQLRGTLCSARQRQLIEILIEEVDERGYLVTPLAELHTELLAGDDVEPGELEQALRILQGFDPTGVGARDLAECLWLQLHELGNEHPDDPVIALADRIVRDDLLPMVASHEFDKLCKLLRSPEALLSEALRLIRRLDPRPGNRYSAEPPAYVRPDVIVRRRGLGWQAVLNRHVVPDLRVNPEYARLFKNHQSTKTSSPSPSTEAQSGQVNGLPTSAAAAPSGTPEAPPVDDSLGKQLQEAQWMVKNVQQRFETILRVSQAIVDRQLAFFEQGAVGMQPLVLREIADAVGLAESTISRATTQKYMATPHGVFELKHFFGSHVATESGGTVSSTAIRELIRQFIDQEVPTQPLSDNQLTELLGQRGIIVARRTVAKYRESLGKLPAAQRKIR